MSRGSDNEGADTPGKPAGRVGRAISGRPSDGTGRPGRVGRERGAMDACWRGRECIAAVASAAGMSGRAGIPGAVGIAGNVGIAGRAGQVGTTRPGAVGIATSSSPATSPTGDNEILAGAAAASNGTETPSDSDTAAAGTGRVGSTGNVGIAGKVGTRRPGTVGIDTSISPPTSPTGGTEILAGAAAARDGTETPSDSDIATAGTGRGGRLGGVGRETPGTDTEGSAGGTMSGTARGGAETAGTSAETRGAATVGRATEGIETAGNVGRTTLGPARGRA